MDGMNRILTFILGIVVVAIIIAIISSRLKLGNSSLFSFNNNGKVTPKPTILLTNSPTKSPKKGIFSFFGSNKTNPTSQPTKTSTTMLQTNGQKLQTIPKTGPELLLPIIAASLIVGVYLRKRS